MADQASPLPRAIRVALFSGNYNYVRDGANQALNRLVGYLLQQGAAVRVFSPTTDTPAFPATGELISVPSIPFPFGRDEYRLALGLFGKTRSDLEAFAPDIIHVSAPDILGHRAVNWALGKRLPVIASMHTRFETYLGYYGLDFLRPALEAVLRRYYQRCNAVLSPTPGMARQMADSGFNQRFFSWMRGIDASRFNPSRRDLTWRRSLDIGDEDVAVGFLGRIVLEKGLDVVAETIKRLKAGGVRHKLLIVGEGPAQEWLAKELPDAIFAGFLSGDDLGRAVASMDVLFNPSVTEAFGNVTLEAMACGLPVLAANASGSDLLVGDGVTGWLVQPGDLDDFAKRLTDYCTDEALRRAHGNAGLDASKVYDWDAINGGVLEAYRTLIAEAAARR